MIVELSFIALLCAAPAREVRPPPRSPEVTSGVASYEALRYDEARASLERAEASGALSASDQQLALAYLARIDAITGNTARAQERFQELLLQQPDFAPGPEESRKIREAFVAARATLLARQPAPPADAPTPPSSPRRIEWFDDSTWRGGRGIHRLEAPQAVRLGEIVVGVGGELSIANDVVTPGDEHRMHAEHVVVAFSPLDALELSARWSAVSHHDDGAVPTNVRYRGDPQIAAKYGWTLTPRLALGVDASWLIPTSLTGGGLAPSASVVSLMGTASYSVGRRLQVVANAGYRIDRTRNLANYPLTSMQRHSAGISEEDAVLLGLGAKSTFDLGSVALTPFVEMTSMLGNVVRATGGAKVRPLSVLEIIAGADVRVSGAPSAEQAGIPPWTAFAQILVHFDTVSDTATNYAATPSGPTYRISGRVVDHESGRGVAKAVVTLSGSVGTALATNKDGSFATWPLPESDGLVEITVEAPGYNVARQTVAARQGANLTIALRAVGSDVPAHLKGSIRDARTGLSLRGQVFVPSLETHLDVDASGAFAIELPVGAHEIIISSPGHVTQTKKINVAPGEVIILDVDLRPGASK